MSSTQQLDEQNKLFNDADTSIGMQSASTVKANAPATSSSGGAKGSGRTSPLSPSGKRTSFDGKGTVLTVAGKERDLLNMKLSGVTPDKLHDLISKNVSTLDMNSFIDDISYQGFDRTVYIRAALEKVTVTQFIKFALIGAIRGSNFLKIKESCGSMDMALIGLIDSHIVVKRAKKRDDLTILRFTASIPQWCAYFMLSANVPPKIPSSKCPPQFQFPGAASLPMSPDLRKNHIEFCVRFSKLIGGTFNANIYKTAFMSAIPLTEIPDGIRLQLGVSAPSESTNIDIDDMLKGTETKKITEG